MTQRTARRFSKKKTLKMLAKIGAIVGVVAPTIGAAVVIGIDKVRRRRVPGGEKGFPSLAPADVKVGDNEVRTYTEGKNLYQDMIKAIDDAEEYVYFETYVWRSDAAGHAFKNALYRAADRGVQVFVVYDGFGSFLAHPLFKVFKRHPNLHVHRVKEIRRGMFSGNLRRTGRSHRKLQLTDGKVGFVGGFNIGDDFGSEWRDTHVRITGPANEHLKLGFEQFWNTFRSSKQPELPERGSLPWGGEIKATFNMPSHLLYPVRGQYLDLFGRANQRIDVTTPYFVPDREISRELRRAAKRGVKVRVLIPEYSNHILADWAGRPRLGPLLKAGVEIWLYRHAMIHAKTLSVDNHRSIVGTANIDRLSLMGNFEITVQIDSPAFAEQMDKMFENDLSMARRLTYEEWAARGLWTRLLEATVAPTRLIV